MFGSEERLRERLLKEGRQAQAEVVEAKPTTASRGNFPPDRSERRYLWKLRLRVRPEGETGFDIDLKHYFHVWAPPNEGSTMTVLFDPNDHSKLSIDIDSVVSVPPAANLAQGAEQSGGLKGIRGARERQDAWLRSGQGAIVVSPEANAGISEPTATAGAASLGPGSVLSGDRTELLARLSDLHSSGQLHRRRF